MVNVRICLLSVSVCIFGFSTGFANQPNQRRSPGHLCTVDDPHFNGLVYPEHIAHCARAVSHDEKRLVAEAYGVRESDWHRYEFDHLIPLCAGGSNDVRNLWPQPLFEAHEKDKVEVEVCNGMRSGQMTQREAVRRIWAWIHSNPFRL